MEEVLFHEHTCGNCKNYVGIGKGKVNTPPLKLLFWGIMAGIFIGIGGWPMRWLQPPSEAPWASWWEPVCSPAGLALVLIAGSELLPETVCWLFRFGGRSEILRRSENWVFVYLGNFVALRHPGFSGSFRTQPISAGRRTSGCGDVCGGRQGGL